jgi:hypothetical protein
MIACFRHDWSFSRVMKTRQRDRKVEMGPVTVSVRPEIADCSLPYRPS